MGSILCLKKSQKSIFRTLLKIFFIYLFKQLTMKKIIITFKNESMLCSNLMIKIILLLLFIFQLSSFNNNIYGQCQPYITIDGNLINANQIHATGLTLPAWLKAGQTLAANQMVNSISVIAFTINGSALEFKEVIQVTSQVTVPNGEVWKIESIFKQPSMGNANSVTMSQSGQYSFTVPACANYICIEVWGAGGGGGGGINSGSTAGGGGGGGGGGYGQQCFIVTPNTNYTVTVGVGGVGGTVGGSGNVGNQSSVGTLISATGGNGGSGGASGTGGTGGSSTAAIRISGSNGQNQVLYVGGRGGSGGNGGLGGDGGIWQTLGFNGNSPGGGGGGGGGTSNSSGAKAGSNGADGKVIISW